MRRAHAGYSSSSAHLAHTERTPSTHQACFQRMSSEHRAGIVGISAHILRWMAAFLLDRTRQRVKLGNNYPHTGHPNGGVPQGTICGPKCFMMYINYLSTPVPLYKYVDDSTLF